MSRCCNDPESRIMVDMIIPVPPFSQMVLGVERVFDPLLARWVSLAKRRGKKKTVQKRKTRRRD